MPNQTDEGTESTTGESSTSDVDSQYDKVEETEETKDTEDKEEKEEPSQEGDKNTPDEEKIPFHKDPRFQEVIAAKNKAKEEAEKLTKENQEILDSIKKAQQPVIDEIPPWFSEGFGENPELWTKFSAYDKQRQTAMKEEIMQEVKGMDQSKVQREEEGIQMVRGELDRLKADGNDFDDNKLKSVMLEYGVLDFDKGLELYKALEGKDPTIAARKKIASSTKPTGSSEGESKSKTLGEMINKGW